MPATFVAEWGHGVGRVSGMRLENSLPRLLWGLEYRGPSTAYVDPLCGSAYFAQDDRKRLRHDNSGPLDSRGRLSPHVLFQEHSQKGQSQRPHPFDFAQGRLCRKERDKDGAPGSVYPENSPGSTAGVPSG
jgi:hypothetical protein